MMKMKKKRSFAIQACWIVATILLALPVVTAALSIARADECRGNSFQPTFVRHNSVPRVYYVEPNGRFTPMNSQAEAQATCRARGVRQAIGGGTCFQRNWGDFGCGCNITPSPNSTCARFQATVVASVTGGAATAQFCRNLYARADAENRAGNLARERGNPAGARARYQQALALFRQGATDRRCVQFQAQFNNAAAIVQRNIQRVAGGMRPPSPLPPGGANADVTMRVVGVWHWFTGKAVTINADHTMVNPPSNSGTWSYAGNNTYVFKWRVGGYVDRLVWSPGPPPRLSGKNNFGVGVWGTQTRRGGR